MADVKLIPLEVLLGNPERAAAQISPDGKRLSYMAPLDGVLNVFVGDAGAGNERPVTHDTDRGIQGYVWAHDNRHIMYVRDKDGSENFRLYDVDLETGVERDLTPLDDVQCRLIAHRKEFPNDVLIGLNKDNPQLHDVYHLDLTTGKLEKIVENPGFLGWVVDTDLKVRGAIAPTTGRRHGDPGARRRGVRLAAAAGGRRRRTRSRRGRLASRRTATSMYLQTSVESNTGRLVKMDIATGAVEVIAEDPVYDITGAMMNPDTREIEAVMVYGDRLEYRIFDDAIRDDIEALQRLHPGRLVDQRPKRRRHDLACRVRRRLGAREVLHVGPRREDGDVPVRPPAATQRLPAGADGALQLHRARRTDDSRLPLLPGGKSSARICPPC